MAKQKAKEVEEVEATESTIENEAVELVETEEVIPKKRAKKQKTKGLFWKNPTFFAAFGTVTGKVTAEQEEEFIRVTKDNNPPADIMDKVLDYDPIAKRHAEAKEKARKRAGLPAEDK